MKKELTEEELKKFKIARMIIQGIIIVCLIAGAIYATIKIAPIVSRIKDDPEYRQLVSDKIESFQGYSFLIIVGLQVLQTILAVIPAGPFVMLSGMLFNPFVGICACVLGQTIGAVIIYALVKLFGYNFVALFFDPNKIKESKLLKNEEQTKVLMFGYLCIPALPKDITQFIAPFTKINLLDFTLITFFARIPMTVVTVLIGSSLSNGMYILGIILACCSGLLAAMCFIFNKKIVAFLEKFKIRKKKVEELSNEE